MSTVVNNNPTKERRSSSSSDSDVGFQVGDGVTTQISKTKALRKLPSQEFLVSGRFMPRNPKGDKVPSKELGDMPTTPREALTELELEKNYIISKIIMDKDDYIYAYNGKTLLQRLDTVLCNPKKTPEERAERTRRALAEPDKYLDKWLRRLDIRQLYSVMCGNSLRYTTSAHFLFHSFPTDSERKTAYVKLEKFGFKVDRGNVGEVERQIKEIKNISDRTSFLEKADALFKRLVEYPCTDPAIDYIRARAVLELDLNKSVVTSEDKTNKKRYKHLRNTLPFLFDRPNDKQIAEKRMEIRSEMRSPFSSILRTPSSFSRFDTGKVGGAPHLDVTDGPRRSPANSINDESRDKRRIPTSIQDESWEAYLERTTANVGKSAGGMLGMVLDKASSFLSS